ncbi:MAG: hypothetical protein PQJ60_11900, partial [Spirochaetales bacterium]|nr:hypothetical protein [Spirochaetales bacterium]
YYPFTLTAPSEGTVTAQFSGGSVTDSSEGLSNESSNQVQMVYDSTAPTPSSDSLTIETNETVPDSLDEFFLDIDIPEASDNIISQGNIQYMIVFSDTESDVSDLTLIDSSLYSSVWSLEYWSTHSEDFYREYINFPYELQTFLSSATSGTDITLYFNLLAKDYSYPGNMDELYYLYGEGNISLHSTTPISVTFTVP